MNFVRFLETLAASIIANVIIGVLVMLGIILLLPYVLHAVGAGT